MCRAGQRSKKKKNEELQGVLLGWPDFFLQLLTGICRYTDIIVNSEINLF